MVLASHPVCGPVFTYRRHRFLLIAAPGARSHSREVFLSHDSIVITGLGAVTPYGTGVPAMLGGLYAGVPTAQSITKFDTTGFPTRFACEVRDPEITEYLPAKLIPQLDPFARYAVIAAGEALRDAGLLPQDTAWTARKPTPVQGVDPDRFGSIISSSVGGIEEMSEQHRRLLADGPQAVRPFFSIAMPLNMAAAQSAIRYGLRGPSFAPVSACASGADALGLAIDLIRSGRADAVLAGGAEAAITPLVLAGFGIAGALSTRNDEPERASRPFDIDRDGFVIGEGAGVLVLERASHAAARGARIYAELAGYGVGNDAYHPSAPAPEGVGAVRAIAAALADARCEATEVAHINAHATSTPINDRSEAMAIRTAYGAAAQRIPIAATKSALGHLVGASGAVEAIATVAAMTLGSIPPILNLEKVDPDCELDLVTERPRAADIPIATSHSFGFGGHNSVLVFRSVADARTPSVRPTPEMSPS